MKIHHSLIGAVGLLLLLLPGCATSPKQAAVLAPDFGALNIRRVAVAPVLFADEPMDWYFGEQVATELRRETIRRLQMIGYEADTVGDAIVRHPPPGNLAAIAPPVPASADALLIIRLDHFLDAGRYDRFPLPLDLFATAALIDRSGRIVWQDTGVGRGNRSVMRQDPLEQFMVPADLAGSLFATLPPVG